ncbi:MAG: conjugal transfer protein [Massilia sp.]|nr:conjugal transfer protein [Massilia sp.]
MFTHLKNIDTAFKHIKQFSIFLIIGNVLTMCFCIYKSNQVINQAQNRIHII